MDTTFANATLRNPDWSRASLRVLLVRLSPFNDVEESTPHLILAACIRAAVPDAFIDFAFLPSAAERVLRETDGKPWLSGRHSGRPATDFHTWFVSLSFALEVVNLPLLLLKSGLEPVASQRRETDPLILLGGSSVYAAPAAVSPDYDSFADALFFGEGEEAAGRIAAVLRDHAAAPRAVRLRAAADAVDGLWVAGHDRKVKQAVLRTITTDVLCPERPLMDGASADTARLTVSLGCPAFCSFCYEGYDRKPYREPDLETLLESARRLKVSTGARTVELYGFNINTHPRLPELLLAMHRLYDRVSFKSQRIDLLQSTPGLLEAEIAAGKSQFTLGVEGISERQRAFLHKSLTTAALTDLIERLLRLPVREIKLFHVLTGHETEEDLAEFREFTRWLRDRRRALNPGLRILFSAGHLVRMPGTPLQFDRLFLDPADFRQITGPVKSACELNGFEFRLAGRWDDYVATQILVLGGHVLFDAVLKLAHAGVVFDGRLPEDAGTALRGALEQAGMWAAFLRRKPAAYPFAFPFVRRPVTDRFLHDQYRLAHRHEDGGYCLGTTAAEGACRTCGACPDARTRKAITRRRVAGADRTFVEHLRQTVAAKHRLEPRYAVVDVAPALAGASPEWKGAALLRALFATAPALADGVLSAEDVLWGHRALAERFPDICGHTVFALRARDEAWAKLEAVLSKLDSPHEGLRFIRWVDRFTPGVFTTCELEVVFGTAAPDLPARVQQALKELPLALEMRATTGGIREYRISAKDQRRKTVLSARLAQQRDESHLVLTIGPKFDGAVLRAALAPAPVLTARMISIR